VSQSRDVVRTLDLLYCCDAEPRPQCHVDTATLWKISLTHGLVQFGGIKSFGDGLVQVTIRVSSSLLVGTIRASSCRERKATYSSHCLRFATFTVPQNVTIDSSCNQR